MIASLLRTLALGIALVVFSTCASAQTRDRTVFVSDLHLGAGRDDHGQWRTIEDFRWQADFDSFLTWIASAPNQNSGVILVFAGDTFELWQSPTMKCSGDFSKPSCVISDCNEDDLDAGCDESEALARFNYVLNAHDDFVRSIQAFVRDGRNQVRFIPGNHDAALLFPAVGARLLEAFGSASVQVQTAGYWLSEDGKIFSDHGHQFDDVNMFRQWPSPFVDSNGIKRLRRPWGENMVQRFYNQYEDVFPIVDNMSDEQTGISLALKQASASDAINATANFFRLILFQESLTQAYDLLGNDKKTVWDYGDVRRQKVDFFVEFFRDGSKVKQAAQLAQSKAKFAFEPSLLTDAEIDAHCAAREKRTDLRHCKRKTSNLGGIVKTTLIGSKGLEKIYLRKTLPAVAKDPKNLAALYVFGHTHRSELPEDLSLGDLQFGSVDIKHVNTGAFQRVANVSQVNSLLSRPDMAGKTVLDLKPEDLPACYNFVLIEPYESAPEAVLQRWANTNGTGFAVSVGRCLDL